jgi:hypothetical protein
MKIENPLLQTVGLSFSSKSSPDRMLTFCCLNRRFKPLDPIILTDNRVEIKRYSLSTSNFNYPVTFSYDPSRDPGYYAKVSSTFWRDPRYSIIAKGVYTYLLTYATQYEQVNPGFTLMCKQLQISEKTLRKGIRELIAAGLLSVKRRGQGKTNVYTVYFIPLINSFGDKGEQKNYASRSRAARRLAESELKTNKKDSIGFKLPGNIAKGPIDLSKYTGNGKNAFLVAVGGS